jgi:hypothetical protein
VAGILTVDTIQSDSSYSSTLNVASKMNFAAGMQIGGQDTTFGGMRNRIINGDMRIDQRFAGAATTNAINDFVVDRWVVGQTTTGKLIAQQNLNSLTPPPGFTTYLGVTSQSAYSIGSSDIFRIYQTLEGYNVADLGLGTVNAQPMTLSFWVRSSLTGLFGGAFNNASGRYPFSYTINSANTWEYKTVTIVNSTTLGNANITNGSGISIQFSLGTGTTFSGPSGVWSATNYLSATGTTSVVGTSGATFYVTGVQLEKGSAASPFENRQFGQELALCQRYYQTLSGGGNNVFGTSLQMSNGANYFPISTKVPMRASPTFTSSGSFQVLGSADTPLTVTAGPTLRYGGADFVSLTWTISSPTTGNASLVQFAGGGGGSLNFSAEL